MKKSKSYYKMKKAFEIMNRTANLEARVAKQDVKDEPSEREKAWNEDYEARLREFHRTGDWSVWTR